MATKPVKKRRKDMDPRRVEAVMALRDGAGDVGHSAGGAPT